MRILYGVCGEGMGHATRTKVTLAHLTARGHDVLVVASDQALRVLRSLSTSGAVTARTPPSSLTAPEVFSSHELSHERLTRAELGWALAPQAPRRSGSELPGGSGKLAGNGEQGASGGAKKLAGNGSEGVRAGGGGKLAGNGEQGASEGVRTGSVRVVPIVGLGMRCADGALDLRGTLEENAQRLPRMMIENASAWAEAEAFRPDIVITDYDSFTWFFARAHHLRLISIDNAQILPRCVHRADVLAPHHDGMHALEVFTNAKAEGAQHYIVTTFFYPPVKPHLCATTTIVPPILRREVLDALHSPRARESHDHVLVYKTGSLDDTTILTPLAKLPDQHFVVYGLRDMNAALPKNVEAKPYDGPAFLRHLASARAVIANSGMSLLGEALAFGKPMYAVPVRGQYEQVLNACYLQRLGYGVMSDVLDPTLLRMFLAHRQRHEDAIRRVPQHDANRSLYAALDRLIA